MRLSIVCALLIAPAATAFASEEGVLPWSSFSVHSAGIGESGPVDVAGTYADANVTTLSIKAFGKEYTLGAAQLQQLKGVYLNGMQLSYEAGYEELGGRTIYLVVSMGFTTGARAVKLITLNERGDITVTSHKAAEQ